MRNGTGGEEVGGQTKPQVGSGQEKGRTKRAKVISHIGDASRRSDSKSGGGHKLQSSGGGLRRNNVKEQSGRTTEARAGEKGRQ